MKINGKKVVDAKQPLRIIITARDAAQGKNKDPGGCAAALAIVRGYRKEGVKNARVHVGRVYVEYNDRWVRYHTPANLKAEIISFDRGASPKFMQGEYNLQKIAPTDRLGARRKPAGPRSGKRARVARIHHQIEGVRSRGANR